MGLFSSSSKSTSTTQYKPGPWQTQGMEYFSDLLKQGGNYPTQQIADLTPFQQAIQQYLQSSFQAGQQNYQLATDQLRQTVSGGYDPMTSPYYQGFRQLAEEEKANTINAIRQRSQMGGMLLSSPAVGMETEANRQYSSMILQELGRLQLAERQNQLGAAMAMPGMESENIRNMAAGSALGELPRQVEQQRMDANYKRAMDQFLFPYTIQAGIANALIGSDWGATIVNQTKQSGTPSLWSSISSMAGAGTGVAGGIADWRAANAQANYYNQLAGFWERR